MENRYCTNIQIDDSEIRSIICWLCHGEERVNLSAERYEWCVVWCHDGVLWGKYINSKWMFPDDKFKDFVPRPSGKNILEARVFSSEKEIHFWRVSDGNTFTGRKTLCLKNDDGSYIAPEYETRLLMGEEESPDKSLYDNDFVLVREKRGSRQVLPKVNGVRPKELHVVHFFDRYEQTGAVRYNLCKFSEIG